MTENKDVATAWTFHYLSDLAHELDSPNLLCPVREPGACNTGVKRLAMHAPLLIYTCLPTGVARSAEVAVLGRSHLKNPQPDVLELAELGAPFTQEKNHRPMLGPGV